MSDGLIEARSTAPPHHPSGTAQTPQLCAVGELTAAATAPKEPKDLVEQHASDRRGQDDRKQGRVDLPAKEVDVDVFGVLDRDHDGEDGEDHTDHQRDADTSSTNDRAAPAMLLDARCRAVRRVRHP